VDPEGRERIVLLEEGREGPICVGRAPENDLQIISPYISRRHAEIWPHERGILYEDLSSTSGSYVDGARVEKCVVGAHESVRLGSPDGLVLTVFALDDSSGVDQVRRAGRTEILRVTDFDESPYLTSTDRGMPTRRRSTIEHRVEERLIALINLTSDLLLVDNIDTMADDLLSRVMAILPATRGMVLVEGKPGDLEPRAWNVRGKSDFVRSERVVLGPQTEESTLDGLHRPELPFHPIRTVTERVFSEGVGLLSLDASSDQRLEGSKSVMLQSVRSIMAAPIASSKKVYGVLYIDTHRTLRKDDEDSLDWLVAVAHQAGMVMDKLTLVAQQREMLESMMRGLAASIDARDGLTAGHSARVAHYSVGIARTLDLSVDEQFAIYYAALLHDYGKIGIDDAVLKKPDRLTEGEFDHIRQHAKFTFDILSKISFPPELEGLPMMAASHHERWDGTGYPWGLRAEEIPVAGRIIAIADVYDSLTRKRHYRDPMPITEVLELLEDGRGTHFGPAELDAFLSYHQEELNAKERRRRARKKSADSGAHTTGKPPAVRRKAPEDDDDATQAPGQRMVLPPGSLEEDTMRLEPEN